MTNQERNRSTPPAGDPIPERRGCGLPGRRRRIAATTANRAEIGSVSRLTEAHVEPEAHAEPSPVTPAVILRRWSVAELIARAAMRPAESIAGR